MARPARWWNVGKEEHLDADELKGALARAVSTRADYLIEEYGNERTARNERWNQNYENRLSDYTAPGVAVPAGIDPCSITLNVTASCIDAVNSKMSAQDPKPQYLTTDGDFKAQQKAKMRQRFVMGSFLDGGYYDEMEKVRKDSLIFDMGVMKIFARDDRIVYERVHPNEIVWDEKAARRGAPGEFFHVMELATDVVCSEYPDEKDNIELSANSGNRGGDAMGIVDDFVEVYEAWHEPSSKGDDDGRHCICTKYATLVDEPWTYNPFIFVRWETLTKGFGGQGLAEQLSGLQDSITNQLQRMERAHDLLGVPWVLKPGGCTMKNASWDNGVGKIMEFDGPPPVVQVHGVLAPEVYTWLDYKYQKAFEISGISQLSATSRKPVGFDPSGVALQAYLETETIRFAAYVKAYHKATLDASRVTVQAARHSDSDVISHWRMKEWAREIPWSSIDDPDDKFVCQLWPTNLMPDSPSGKLSYVERMVTTGVYKPEEARMLLAFPDVEALDRTGNAARELVEMIIDVMLEDERYIAPTKHMNLKMAIYVVQGAILRAELNDWGNAKLSLLSRWLDEAALLDEQAQLEEVTQAQKLQAAQQPPAPPPAPGPPTPPPPGPEMMMPPPPMDAMNPAGMPA